jgi:hypothetical protein
MIPRSLRAAAFLLLLLAAGFAHAQGSGGYVVNVIGSKVQNGAGQLLASGQICFQPTSQNGVPINFAMGSSSGQVGGGGQVTDSPICATVTAGAFSLQLASVDKTSPQYVCFATTVRAAGKVVLQNGYQCVQPVAYPASGSQPATWCSGTTCNFDSYEPNLPSQALVQTGPPGPSGTVINWRGLWSSGTSYNANDGVSYSGVGYVAIAASTGSEPDISPSKWAGLAPGAGGTLWGSITGTLSNQTDLNTALGGKAASNASTTVNGQSCGLSSGCTVADATKEPALGNPSTNGYVLSSTAAGVRSWIAQSSGGGGTWGSITGTLSNQTDLSTALSGKEPALGNPSSNGYVLSSTTAGVRSWIAQSSGGGGTWGSITGTLSNQTDLSTALSGKEPALGNPSANGYVLSSTSAGVRTWIAASGGGGTWGSITGTLSSQTDLQTALNAKAPSASPALTGVPTTPTQATNDNSTQIVNSAWVRAQGYGAAGSAAWGAITGTLSNQTDLNTALSAKAPSASPSFTGTVTTPITGGGVQCVEANNGGVLSGTGEGCAGLNVFQFSAYGAVGDDSTDNCANGAVTAFTAAVNSYGGAGVPFAMITSGPGGKAFKLVSCKMAFTIPVTLFISATIDCAQASGQCITLGPSVSAWPSNILAYTITGCGTFIGGANTSNAIEVEQYVAIAKFECVDFHNFGNATGWAINELGNNNETVLDAITYWDDDTTTGRKFFKSNDALATGSNTVKISNVHAIGAGAPQAFTTPCAGVLFQLGGTHTSMENSSLYGAGQMILLTTTGNASDMTIGPNVSMDDAGCVGPSGVQAPIQVGSVGHNDELGGLQVINNDIENESGDVAAIALVSGATTPDTSKWTISNNRAEGPVKPITNVSLGSASTVFNNPGFSVPAQTPLFNAGNGTTWLQMAFSPSGYFDVGMGNGNSLRLGAFTPGASGSLGDVALQMFSNSQSGLAGQIYLDYGDQITSSFNIREGAGGTIVPRLVITKAAAAAFSGGTGVTFDSQGFSSAGPGTVSALTVAGCASGSYAKADGTGCGTPSLSGNIPESQVTNLTTDLAGKQASLGFTPLNPANNLSEVTASTARTNLGLGTAATHASTDFQAAGSYLTSVPAPTSSTLGGVNSHSCGSGNAVQSINTDGSVTCAASGSSGTNPGYIAITYNGNPAASTYLVNISFPYAFTIPANCTGSTLFAVTGPSGAATYTLYKNGTSFGTVYFASGATTGTWTCASSTSFAANSGNTPGDILSVMGGGVPQIANLGGGIYGTH